MGVFSLRATCVVGGVVWLLSCQVGSRGDQVADLVLRGGVVVTVDSSVARAEAVAVDGDRILAVGSNRDVSRFIGDSTKVIELAGRLALPGFIEGHGHFMGLGRARMVLDLTRVSSWDEIVSMVGHVAGDADTGAWILGRGWHQEKWTATPPGSVDGVPTHATLSRVSPNNPVLLTHASGHAAFANAKALELAGIDHNTPDPPGGEIVHDARGEPTGLLRERAQGLVGAVRERSEAARTAADREAAAVKAVELAGEDLVSKGITSFHDAGEQLGRDRIHGRSRGG